MPGLRSVGQQGLDAPLVEVLVVWPLVRVAGVTDCVLGCCALVCHIQADAAPRARVAGSPGRVVAGVVARGAGGALRVVVAVAVARYPVAGLAATTVFQVDRTVGVRVPGHRRLGRETRYRYKRVSETVAELMIGQIYHFKLLSFITPFFITMIHFPEPMNT